LLYTGQRRGDDVAVVTKDERVTGNLPRICPKE
jgi:hypothetical protein